ncbi:MAG: class I SAM-dependent methyltransferase [Bermanella sp.]
MTAHSKHEWPCDLGNEFHDLQELALNMNLTSGELMGSWGNLGYWQDENGASITHYSEAAKQLAHRLGEFAQLSSVNTVIDMGFGCGDQLIHWHQAFAVSHISGVNVSHVQTQYAQRKVKAWQLDQVCDVYQGDASDERTWAGLPTQFDRILALDCVYHFSNKNDFFTHCARRLKYNHNTTELVISDLVLSKPLTSFFSKAILGLICYVSRIPRQNLKTRHDYEAQLDDMGLQLIAYEDASAHVMLPFAQWVERHKKAVKHVSLSPSIRNKLNHISWGKYVGTAWFLRWAHQHNIFQYAFFRIGLKQKAN